MSSDIDREPPMAEECLPHLFIGMLYSYAVNRNIQICMVDKMNAKIALGVKPRASEVDMYNKVIADFGESRLTYSGSYAIGACLVVFKEMDWEFQPNLFKL